MGFHGVKDFIGFNRLWDVWRDQNKLMLLARISLRILAMISLGILARIS